MEGGGGERPTQPIVPPGGERNGSGQAFNVDRPIDLVGNFRSLIQQERAKGNPYFNAAWWLRSEMKSIMNFAIGQKEPQEKQQFFADLRIAWELVAYKELEEYRDSVYSDIRTFGGGRKSVTLSPLGVTMLDAMTVAADILHTPGQATFDIALFSGQAALEKIESGAPSLAPTNEEVRRAITTQPN